MPVRRLKKLAKKGKSKGSTGATKKIKKNKKTTSKKKNATVPLNKQKKPIKEEPINDGDSDIETKFSELSDITNQVALINSAYEEEEVFEAAIEKMEVFIKELHNWNMEEMSPTHRQYYLSHMSFHREIIAEIIADARALLIEERREYLRRLVSYYKSFCDRLDSLSN